MKYLTRLERILDMPMADDAIRQWPQSGEAVHTKLGISKVESHFEGFKLGIGRRIKFEDKLIVEWTSDYGDGKLYRNVTIAELKNGFVTKITDYWGAPFDIPEWRKGLTKQMDEQSVFPKQADLIGDEENGNG
ncbi:MAG: hypothetical protein R2831_09305 [Chitinophagaceae bacterium]